MEYVIILNGEKPKKPYLTNEQFKVICADGGYKYALETGLKVDALLGDMDSVGDLFTPNFSDTVKIISYNKDKNSTDGELALDYAIESGAKSVTFIGATGGRDDHYLGNITLLYRALKKGVKAKFYTDLCEVYMFEGSFLIDCPKNKYFSLVPFGGNLHIINTEGLKYKIFNQTLYLHETLGISNETVSGKVLIESKSGTGIAVLTFEDVK